MGDNKMFNKIKSTAAAILALGALSISTPADAAIYHHGVCFKAANGVHFMVAEGDRQTVNANRIWCSVWEKFTIVDINGGRLRNGDLVHVISAHGKYMSAQPDGRLVANRNWPGAWETFKIRRIGVLGPRKIRSGHRVALRTVHGTWLSAENGGGWQVAANRPFRNAWETFKIRF